MSHGVFSKGDLTRVADSAIERVQLMFDGWVEKTAEAVAGLATEVEEVAETVREKADQVEHDVDPKPVANRRTRKN